MDPLDRDVEPRSIAARELVAPVFTLHLPLPSRAEQTAITFLEAVHEWVVLHCARFDRLVFSTEVGPFVDTVRGVVAGPWNADTIVEGKPQPVCGMDTIAFRDGRITEYWTISKPVDAFGRWATAGE